MNSFVFEPVSLWQQKVEIKSRIQISFTIVKGVSVFLKRASALCQQHIFHCQRHFVLQDDRRTLGAGRRQLVLSVSGQSHRSLWEGRGQSTIQSNARPEKAIRREFTKNSSALRLQHSFTLIHCYIFRAIFLYFVQYRIERLICMVMKFDVKSLKML